MTRQVVSALRLEALRCATGEAPRRAQRQSAVRKERGAPWKRWSYVGGCATVALLELIPDLIRGRCARSGDLRRAGPRAPVSLAGDRQGCLPYRSGGAPWSSRPVVQASVRQNHVSAM